MSCYRLNPTPVLTLPEGAVSQRLIALVSGVEGESSTQSLGVFQTLPSLTSGGAKRRGYGRVLACGTPLSPIRASDWMSSWEPQPTGVSAIKGMSRDNSDWVRGRAVAPKEGVVPWASASEGQRAARWGPRCCRSGNNPTPPRFPGDLTLTPSIEASDVGVRSAAIPSDSAPARGKSPSGGVAVTGAGGRS